MATTVSADYGKGVLSIQGEPGSSDIITVNAASGVLKVETGSKGSALSLVELGSSGVCSFTSATQLRCPQAGISRIAVDLGDSADQANLSSVSLPVTVTGAGPGAKKVILGGGDDQVSLRDGVADTIECGDGNDTVVGDTEDTVDSDCENVDLGTFTGTPVTDGSSGPAGPDGQTSDGTGSDQGAAGGDSPLTAPIGIVLPAHPVKFPAPNAAVVHVGCAATQTGGCQGDVILELPAQAQGRQPARRVVAARGHFVAQQHRRRLGKGHFKLAAGQSADVPVHITLRGHFVQATKRRNRHGVLKIVVRDSAGKIVGVDTRVVTLKLTNKWSRIHRHGN